MSIRMMPGAARLTVLGNGWDDSSFHSGSSFTENGALLDEVADTLIYEVGSNVDWDLIANDSDLDWDGIWDDVIYTDSNGTVYVDGDNDGIWTDDGGNEYPGGGTRWMSKKCLLQISDLLAALAEHDATLRQYSIPNAELPSLYGGKVSTEITPVITDSERPHTYTPSVWFIQKNSREGVIFLDEPFYHGTADGGSITVYDEAVTIRDGSSKAVYWSSCTSKFTETTLPSQYSGYPIQYVCWQCLYGSLGDALIAKNDNTITSEDIINGTTGMQTMTYNGKIYYAVS